MDGKISRARATAQGRGRHPDKQRAAFDKKITVSGVWSVWGVWKWVLFGKKRVAPDVTQPAAPALSISLK